MKDITMKELGGIQDLSRDEVMIFNQLESKVPVGMIELYMRTKYYEENRGLYENRFIL